MAVVQARSEVPSTSGSLWSNVATAHMLGQEYFETDEADAASSSCFMPYEEAVVTSRDSHDKQTLSPNSRATDLDIQPSDSLLTSDHSEPKSDYQCLTISDFPEEIMLKIFSFLSFNEILDIVPNVCTSWRRMASDAELWRNKEHVIESWCNCSSPNRRCEKTDEQAVETFRRAPQLRSISLQRGARTFVIKELSNNCHELTYLHLSASQRFKYPVMEKLVEKCPKISTFELSQQLLLDRKNVAAVGRLQCLQTLNVEEYGSGSIELRPLADGCPLLSHIDLKQMYMNIQDLEYFLSAKRNILKYIHIRWTMESKRCVTPLLRVCADSLEHLTLCYYDVLPEEAAEAFAAVGQLHELRELRMTFLEGRLKGAVSQAFKSGRLSKLRLLDLADSADLDDGAIISVCRWCPALRELRIRYCSQITDAAFAQIYRLKNLETLDISACENLTGASILYIAKLPALQTLSIEDLNMEKLETGLQSILDMSALRRLTLNSSNVRLVPFDKFPGKLINLRELYIYSCEGDDSKLEEMREKMPDLLIYGSFQTYVSWTDNEENEESDEEDHPEEGNEAAHPEEGNEAAHPEEGNEAAHPEEGNEAAHPEEGNEAAHAEEENVENEAVAEDANAVVEDDSENCCGCGDSSDCEDFDVGLFLQNASLEQHIDRDC